MSNNSHFLAVDAAALQADYDPEDFFSSSGLDWRGDSFESGYVFREQLDTVIGPLLSAHLRSVLDGRAETVTDPAVDLLRSNDDGAAVIALSPAEFAELRAAVGQAVATADWGHHDHHDWAALAADDRPADLYALVEFG